MDPNNALCNWIHNSGQCDYTRMYNFSNYPTANNGFSSGYNGGYGYGMFNSTNMNVSSNGNSVTYSYSNKPSKLMTAVGIFGVVGSVFAAYGAGKAAEEQQTKIAEQQKLQYLQYKEQLADQQAANEKAAKKQELFDTLKLMLMAKSMGIDLFGTQDSTSHKKAHKANDDAQS